MTDRCIHELPPGQCGQCRPRPALPPRAGLLPELPAAARYGRWVTAQFDGDCTGCDEPIEEGDQIRSDGKGGWLCRECGLE